MKPRKRFKKHFKMSKIKEKNIDWTTLPLDDEGLRMAELTDSSYKLALKKGITDKYFARLGIIAKTNQNIINSIYGPAGFGKSFTALYIIEKYQEFKENKLSIKNVAFSILDALKLVEKSPGDEIILLDEQVKTAGYGSAIERTQLENIEMIVRQNRLSFFFIATKFIPHNFHWLLEIIEEKGSVENSAKEPKDINEWVDYTLNKWEYTKSIVTNHRGHKIGYIITKAPSDKEFLIQYKKKKDKFIEDMKKQRGTGRVFWLIDKAYQILETKGFLQEYVSVYTKKMMILTIRMYLAKVGGMIGVDELGQLVDWINYHIVKDTKYKEIAMKINPKFVYKVKGEKMPKRRKVDGQ